MGHSPNGKQVNPEHNPETNQEDYKVGRGKPPLHSRWKKDQSGNPTGKRKREKSDRELLEIEMDRLVQMQENGKIITLSMRKAFVKLIVNRAISGDPLAEKFLMMFEAPEEAARQGPGLEIIHVESDDDIPSV